MEVKDYFIRELIDTLNRENEYRIDNNKRPLDICYMVSIIDQNINDSNVFINDITRNEYRISSYEEDNTGGYTYGSISVYIIKNDDENYYYRITFKSDERSWGYCQCSPEDKDYNSKHDCCGHGCDWFAPAFTIEKVESILNSSWNGDESDYWKFEEEFSKNELNKSEVVEKQKIEQRKQYIKDQIKSLKEELVNIETTQLP
jgi:hypothetical protein